MMQRSSLATRRFYAAFYQWTVRSSLPPRKCIGGNLITQREKHFSRDKRKRKVAQRLQSKGIQSDKNHGAQDGERQEKSDVAAERDKDKDVANNNEPKAFRDKRELLRTLPVISFDDKPKGSLDAWKFEVRAREAGKVSVELSLPHYVIKMSRLHDALEGHEATVEFPPEIVFRRSRRIPHPVMMTGTYNCVNDAWRLIFEASISRDSELNSVYKADSDVKDSSDLVLWSGKTKEIGWGNVKADYCIPETTWQLMLRSGGVGFLEKWFDVNLEPTRVASNDVRQIHLTGRSLDVFRAQGFIRKNEPSPEQVTSLKTDNGTEATDNAQPEGPEEPEDEHSLKIADTLRESLRYVTQPVALLGATSPIKTLLPPDADEKDQWLAKNRGVTVSSLTTVTMKPKPIICFNLKVPSRTWDAIRSSGRVAAYLLTATPEGAAAANMFTKPYEFPHTPFRELQKQELMWIGNTRASLRPPAIRGKPFYTTIMADILPEKCVRVGDHVVVLAEVANVVQMDEFETVKDTGALAYGMQKFRGMGGEIQPLEPPEDDGAVWKEYHESAAADADKDESQTTAQNEAVDKQQSDSAVPPRRKAKTKEARIFKSSSPFFNEEGSRGAMKASESLYIAEGFPTQTAAEEPILNEEQQAISRTWDASSDPPVDSEPQLEIKRTFRTIPAPDVPLVKRVRQTKNNAAKNGQHDTAAEPQSQQGSANRWEPTEAEKPPLPFRITRHYVETDDRHEGGPHSWPQPGSQNRQFSTWARPQSRQYSTKAAAPPIPESILKMNVGEYLVPIAPHQRKYYKLFLDYFRLLRLQNNVLPRDDLWPEDRAELEQELETLRREIGKEMAVRNAHDLRLLLDKNRMHQAEAPWLESMLEEGQALMWSEAKEMRAALIEGKMSIEEFDEVKEELEADYKFIEAQLKRLRGNVEEDEVD